MIKWAFVLGVVFIATAKAASSAERDELLKSIRTAVDDCYEDDAKTIKVDVTDAAFEALITNDPNPQRNTKCMRFCVMKAHDLYNADQTLNITNVQQLIQKIYPDFASADKLKTIADSGSKCMAEVTAKDRCDNAHGIAMCMITALSLPSL